MIETIEQTSNRIQEHLTRWRGGFAQMWEYTVSLRMLTIRLISDDRPGNLHLVCSPCITIRGPVDWDHADLEVTLDETNPGEEVFVVQDTKAGFRVTCRGLAVFGDVEPIY